MTRFEELLDAVIEACYEHAAAEVPAEVCERLEELDAARSAVLAEYLRLVEMCDMVEKEIESERG